MQIVPKQPKPASSGELPDSAQEIYRELWEQNGPFSNPWEMDYICRVWQSTPDGSFLSMPKNTTIRKTAAPLLKSHLCARVAGSLR